MTLPCAVALLLSALLAAGCASPGGSPGTEGTPSLERFTYDAFTGRVSALRSATPRHLAAAAPRIVYVHGTPGDAGAWDAYLHEPVGGATSVAIDRPGFGASEPAEAVVSLAEQAAALKPLLDGDTILVGHSLGGPIIALAAALWPDRVGGLVIIAGSMDPDLEELRWYNRLGEALDGVLSRELANSNREILALRDELEDLDRRMHRVTCPVIVVHGTDDELVPYANVGYMQRALTHAERVEVETLEGASHFLIWQDAHVPVVRQAIARLLDADAL